MEPNNKSGQYALFEDEESQGKLYSGLSVAQKPQQDNLQDLNIVEVVKFIEGRGIYVPIPKDKKLWDSGQTYYKNNVEQIIKYLTASGVTNEAINVVTTDYGNALLGNYSFSASVDTMVEILQRVTPAAVFMIERYGFYRLLLLQYYKYSKTTIDYINNVKNADTATKIHYIETVPTLNYRALGWAIRAGYIRPSDFPDVPTIKFARFVENVRHVSELFDYGQYYHLCKALYLATPEQLKTIRPPKALAEIEARGVTNFAEDFYNDCQDGLSKAMEQYSDPLDSNKTPQEREKAMEQAEKWKLTAAPELVKISKYFNSIMQCPITGRYNTHTLPIKKHIEAFLERQQNERYRNGLLTEDLLQRTIGGLDLMRSIMQPAVVKIDDYNTAYLFQDISISKFAECCGMKDANQKEKIALYGCLQLLKNIYIRVSLPIRQQNSKKGKKKNSGGDIFVQVANIPTIKGLAQDGTIERFTIQLTANDLGGELLPITAGTHKLLQKEAKGMSERRFQAQLLGKDNKNENDLVNECFGFSEMLREAEESENDAEIRRIKKYVQGHIAEKRATINQWFEKYKNLGVITSYSCRQNKDGVIVYRWKRDTAQQIEAPTANEPNAETVDAEQPNPEQNNIETA